MTCSGWIDKWDILYTDKMIVKIMILVWAGIIVSDEGLTTWELYLNTLEGTSTWVVVTETKKGYISCRSVLVEGTSTRLFKENRAAKTGQPGPRGLAHNGLS